MKRLLTLAALLTLVLALTPVAAQAVTPSLSMHRGAAAIARFAYGDGTAVIRVHDCSRRSRITIACTVDYRGASGPLVDMDRGEPVTGSATDHMRATLRHGHVLLWSALFVT